jgi:hypothetical protein
MLVPPRRQTYHEGVQVADACPWSTLRLQEDQEQQQRRPEQRPVLRQP